jgi:hypothetical protein
MGNRLTLQTTFAPPRHVPNRAERVRLAREILGELKTIRANESEAEWMAGRPARLKNLAHYIFIEVQVFVNVWAQKVDLAASTASLPEDEESSKYWYIALAGNMVWAMTIFYNPASAVVRLAALGGAAVGSGVVAHGAATSVVDAKAYFIHLLLLQHRQIENQYLSRRFEWAQELEELRVGEVEGNEELIMSFVWNKMFDIPYDAQAPDTYVKIYDQTKSNIEKLLVEFNRQWKTYRDAHPFFFPRPSYTIMHDLTIKPKPGEEFKPDLGPQLMEIAGTKKVVLPNSHTRGPKQMYDDSGVPIPPPRRVGRRGGS